MATKAKIEISLEDISLATCQSISVCARTQVSDPGHGPSCLQLFFQEGHQSMKNLDQAQSGLDVRPDPGPNCLQRLYDKILW